jgi:hypothetical protein
MEFFDYALVIILTYSQESKPLYGLIIYWW